MVSGVFVAYVNEILVLTTTALPIFSSTSWFSMLIPSSSIVAVNPYSSLQISSIVYNDCPSGTPLFFDFAYRTPLFFSFFFLNADFLFIYFFVGTALQDGTNYCTLCNTTANHGGLYACPSSGFSVGPFDPQDLGTVYYMSALVSIQDERILVRIAILFTNLIFEQFPISPNLLSWMHLVPTEIGTIPFAAKLTFSLASQDIFISESTLAFIVQNIGFGASFSLLMANIIPGLMHWT